MDTTSRITPHSVLQHGVHADNDQRSHIVAMDNEFWARLAAGEYPQLDRGRLMSAFTFDAPWPVWERHPAGEEVVLLLSGRATLLLETADGVQTCALEQAGDFVLVPANVWHTAQTQTSCTLLFLTAGAGTEHRPI